MITILSTPINHIPPNRTILLVDDDKHLRRFMQTLLTHEGYDVILAEDGVDAVNNYIKFMSSIMLTVFRTGS